MCACDSVFKDRGSIVCSLEGGAFYPFPFRAARVFFLLLFFFSETFVSSKGGAFYPFRFREARFFSNLASLFGRAPCCPQRLPNPVQLLHREGVLNPCFPPPSCFYKLWKTLVNLASWNRFLVAGEAELSHLAGDVHAI